MGASCYNRISQRSRYILSISYGTSPYNLIRVLWYNTNIRPSRVRCASISVAGFSYGIIKAIELGAPLEEADKAHLWSSRYQVHEPDIRGVIYSGGWSGNRPLLSDSWQRANIVKLITSIKQIISRNNKSGHCDFFHKRIVVGILKPWTGAYQRKLQWALSSACEHLFYKKTVCGGQWSHIILKKGV